LGECQNPGFRAILLQKIDIRDDSYQRTKNGLNLKKDTELLEESYFDILDRLAKGKQ